MSKEEFFKNLKNVPKALLPDQPGDLQYDYEAREYLNRCRKATVMQGEIIDLTHEVERLYRELDSLEVKKWIKCTDRMPAENENVLVYFPVLKSSTVAYLVHDWQKNPIHFAVVDFCEYDQVLCLENISHWMPLPAYPE